MNPVTGEKLVDIHGERYVLRFTWRALSEIERQYGDSPNLFDAEVVAGVAAAGLRGAHPEMTAERIMELSPPLVPLAKAVQEALSWAYFGAETPAGAAEVKKKRRPPEAGPLAHIARLFRPGSRRRSSGN